MRILALSDLHGNLDVVSVAGNFDYVIIAGDIVTSPKDVGKLPKNSLVVPGNNEDEVVLQEYERLGISIHEKKKKIGNFTIGGVGFSLPTPFHTPGERGEEYFRKVLAGLGKVDILVTHTPPIKCLDDVAADVHIGSFSVREYIEQYQPILHLCGHVHENVGICKVGKTLVVNLPFGKRKEGAVITLDKEIEIRFVHL